MRSKSFPIFALLLAGCDPPPPPGPFRATGELIAFGGGEGGAASACATCHGLQGEGDGHLAPRLAGLDPGYLHRQLDDYVAGRREHVRMRAIARKLSGEDRARVSAYYAGLPAPASAAARPSARGARLYDRGDPARGLQPCAACHGAAGEGDAANPPLAGQPAAYLAQQLTAWREGARHNDPLGAMLAVSRRLSPGEVPAVAAYAAALAGDRRGRDRAAYP